MNLPELFHFLVTLSLLASVLTLGILLIKFLFRQRLSARWHYYIWFVLIFRLLIPITPPSPISVLNLLPQSQQTINLSQSLMRPLVGEALAQSGTKTIPKVAKSFGAGTNPQSFSQRLKLGLNWETAALIWLIGVLGFLVYILLANGLQLLKFKRQQVCTDPNVSKILNECRTILRVRGEVAVIYDDTLRSPALFGLFRPKIRISPQIIALLPTEELRYIFLHELSHLKRRDLIINTCVTLIQVVYWFNPLIWYGLYQMKQDCEIACDATALSTIQTSEHKRYGQTVIAVLQLLSESRWVRGSVSFASKANTRRIIMITTLKKTQLKWTLAALALTLLVGCSSLTAPVTTARNMQAQQGVIAGGQQNSGTGGTSGANSDARITAPVKPVATDSTSPSEDTTSRLLRNMMRLAQEGKVIDCDFPVKTTTIDVVAKAWGKADQTDYVAAAKGTYATYSNNDVVFGYNKGDQIFEVRSFANQQFTALTAAKVKAILGTPDYDVTYKGQEIIGYTVQSEFKIEMVFPQSTLENSNLPMDHYNVLYPQGTVNIMANDPGRQW